jgi:hypothetical protein
MASDGALDRRARVIGRVTLDEHQFRSATHVRCALKDLLDVAGLVPRRHDHRHPRLARRTSG